MFIRKIHRTNENPRGALRKAPCQHSPPFFFFLPSTIILLVKSRQINGWIGSFHLASILGGLNWESEMSFPDDYPALELRSFSLFSLSSFLSFFFYLERMNSFGQLILQLNNFHSSFFSFHFLFVFPPPILYCLHTPSMGPACLPPYQFVMPVGPFFLSCPSHRFSRSLLLPTP